MARLIDDIRRAPRLEVPQAVVAEEKLEAWAKHAEKVWHMIAASPMPVMVADNVSTYYFEGTGQEIWDLKLHFPNLAPPYPMFWIEFRMPKRIHSDTKGDTNIDMSRGRVGWLMAAANREDATLTEGEFPEGTRWVYAARCSSTTAATAIYRGRTGSGRPLHRRGRAPARQAVDSVRGRSMTTRWCGLSSARGSPGAACHLLHALQKRAAGEQRVPAKLARRTREKYGYTPTPYHTLIIEPLKEILRREGKSDSTGLAQAMHICHGQVRDYREGKGLFGKYHQVVWDPVRGARHQEPTCAGPGDRIKL